MPIKDKPTPESDVLTRRDFLQGATLGSAALVATSSSGASAHANSGESQQRKAQDTIFGELCALTPGAVEPEGWLRLYLEKQEQQLGSQLTKVSWPFTSAYWSGEEGTDGHGWWGWEQKGYWIDGAVRCALVLRNEALLSQAKAPIDYTLNHVDINGYLGPAYLRDTKSQSPPVDQARWPHNVFFRALAAYAEGTQDARIASALSRHYRADDRSLYLDSPLALANVEGMLWAYQQTGDRELLTIAKKLWDDFVRDIPLDDRQSCDLHPQRVLSGTRIHAHGVAYSEAAKLPAILYLHTGEAGYLRYAVAAQERMFTHHMLIDGLPSSAEEFWGVGALDAHETCNISSMTWGWGYLLMATGEAIWGDRIERACLNAGFGSIKKDWTGVQYLSSPNQVIATHNSSHAAYGHGSFSSGWMAYRPNPGHETACCSGNVHRFLPNYVIRMWMSDGSGGLAAVLYGSSTVRAKVGRTLEPVEISQETHYPFGEDIHFNIRATRAVSFRLALRIPGWCKAPRLAVNGEPSLMPPLEKGFAHIERLFQPGDRITLTLPMTISASTWPNSWAFAALGIEHGPLVYALGIKENWSSTVTPKWSTAEFPEWDATAASAWNYGIAIDGAQLASQAKIERLPMTEDPWVSPPVKIAIPVKKIPGWILEVDPNSPDRVQTPAMPGPKVKTSPEQEQLALVPYGATHLRVSIFPQVT